MDDDQLNSGLVDQVFMGYGGYGSSGMCALASSFQDPRLQAWWEQFLIHYARLGPSGQINPPPFAFTYVTVGDGSAAILRRVQEGDTTGRNNGHALVGPAAFLGPRALQLANTFRWAVRPEEMGQDPYSVEQLSEMISAPGGVALLDDEGDSARCVDSAIRMMGRVLETPLLNVSFIGLDYNLIIPTLELFEAVLRPLFAIEPPIRSWTFSTYEERDADPGETFTLPELIFLPALPSHVGETHHHRIFLDDNAHVEDQYHRLAEMLVKEYFTLGSNEHSSVIEEVLSSKETVTSRIRYLLGGRSHGPSSHRRMSEAPDQPPQESRQSGVRHENPEWKPAIGGDTSTSNPRGTPSPPSIPSQPMPEPNLPVKEPVGQPPQSLLNDYQLVRQLANAVTRREADSIIELLRGRTGSTPDRHRWNLISSPAVLSSLAVIFCPWELNTPYRRLLKFAFGADTRALQQQEYFNWIKDYVMKSDANYFFSHTIFSLVEGSPAAPHYHDLLRRRWESTHSIPLMALRDADRPSVRHWASARRWASDLLAEHHNRQLLIVIILVILMASIIMVTIIFTWP